MWALMDRVLARYGMEAILTSGNVQKKIRVFFHSINSRSMQNMEKVHFPLGEIPRGKYICILPAGAGAVGDTLTIGGRAYELCRVEEMTVQEGSVYQWSLCREKGGMDTWGSEE